MFFFDEVILVLIEAINVGDAERRRGLSTKKSDKRSSPKWIVIFELFLGVKSSQKRLV